MDGGEMPLTLEVVGRKAAQMGAGARKVFQEGGTIGRLRDNDWVFPDQYISGRHARISFVDGRYLIEDTSTNGVFVNSLENRIPRGEPYPLQHGDTLYVDDYEVRVSLQGDFDSAEPPAGFVPRDAAPRWSDSIPMGDDSDGAEDVDPMRLLGLEAALAHRQGPRADALAGASPLSQHYRPPAPLSPSPFSPEASCGDSAPEDYDPFAADDSSPFRDPPQPAARLHQAKPAPPRPEIRDVPARMVVQGGGTQSGGGPGGGAPVRARVTVRASAVPIKSPPSAARPNARPDTGTLDFAALLAAAGIESARISPQTSQQFGKIIRVVVSGLMEVLQARGKIKDEFRLRLTTFKHKDNNPLKFSANVEDALHNILVKRNAAYLGPAEAFEDAFQDVRNHQMAMLAGMRVAFDSMLAEFAPERLKKDFDEQIKTRSFLSASARSQYWELYCNRFRETVKDADSSFRNLFGDEFAKAYEDQLARLSVKRGDRQ
jgi:type VI secretion system protein ImpI